MTIETTVVDQICSARDRVIIDRVKRKYRVRVCRSVEHNMALEADLIADLIGRIQGENFGDTLMRLYSNDLYWNWGYYYQRPNI